MSSQIKLLVLNKHYEPHQWLSLEEAITAEAKDQVIEHLGESIFVYRGGTNRDGVASSIETSSIIVIEGIAPYKVSLKPPSLTNMSLFQRDRFMCAYCGQKFKSMDLTRDHVKPRSRGGPDSWMNVVASCKGCNSLKDDTLPGQKLPKDTNGRQIFGPQGTGFMDPLYVPYVPCKVEHMIMRNRNIKADQMQFLLERVHNRHSRIFDYAKDLFAEAA